MSPGHLATQEVGVTCIKNEIIKLCISDDLEEAEEHGLKGIKSRVNLGHHTLGKSSVEEKWIMFNILMQCTFLKISSLPVY